jgi:hypothetical protein
VVGGGFLILYFFWEFFYVPGFFPFFILFYFFFLLPPLIFFFFFFFFFFFLPNTICPLNLNPKNDTVYLSNRSRPYTYTTVTIEICRAPYETHALLHTAEGLCCSLIAIDPLHAQYASRSTVHKKIKKLITLRRRRSQTSTQKPKLKH